MFTPQLWASVSGWTVVNKYGGQDVVSEVPGFGSWRLRWIQNRIRVKFKVRGCACIAKLTWTWWCLWSKDTD